MECTGRILSFYKKIVGCWATSGRHLWPSPSPPPPLPQSGITCWIIHMHVSVFLGDQRQNGKSACLHCWKCRIIFVEHVFLLGDLTCFGENKAWSREDSFSLMAEVIYAITNWQIGMLHSFRYLYCKMFLNTNQFQDIGFSEHPFHFCNQIFETWWEEKHVEALKMIFLMNLEPSTVLRKPTGGSQWDVTTVFVLLASLPNSWREYSKIESVNTCADIVTVPPPAKELGTFLFCF